MEFEEGMEAHRGNAEPCPELDGLMELKKRTFSFDSGHSETWYQLYKFLLPGESTFGLSAGGLSPHYDGIRRI